MTLNKANGNIQISGFSSSEIINEISGVYNVSKSVRYVNNNLIKIKSSNSRYGLYTVTNLTTDNSGSWRIYPEYGLFKLNISYNVLSSTASIQYDYPDESAQNLLDYLNPIIQEYCVGKRIYPSELPLKNPRIYLRVEVIGDTYEYDQTDSDLPQESSMFFTEPGVKVDSTNMITSVPLMTLDKMHSSPPGNWGYYMNVTNYSFGVYLYYTSSNSPFPSYDTLSS